MNNSSNPKDNDNKARSVALVRYGLAILLTAFLFREVVYMTSTPYPMWLMLVLFVSVLALLVPYERLLGGVADSWVE